MGLRERGLVDHVINIYLTRMNPSRSYDVPRGTQTPFGRRNPNLGFLSTHEHLHVRHECDSLREYSWGCFISFCVSLTTLLPRDTVENSCKEPGYRKRPKRCFVSTNPVCMPLFMTLRCQLLLHFCCCCCCFFGKSLLVLENAHFRYLILACLHVLQFHSGSLLNSIPCTLSMISILTKTKHSSRP